MKVIVVVPKEHEKDRNFFPFIVNELSSRFDIDYDPSDNIKMTYDILNDLLLYHFNDGIVDEKETYLLVKKDILNRSPSFIAEERKYI